LTGLTLALLSALFKCQADYTILTAALMLQRTLSQMW